MRIYLLAATFLLGGCLADSGLGTESQAQFNIPRLQELQIGMNEEEVYRIMRAPRYVDQIVLQDGCYDIWFYVTKGTVLDQSQLVQRNLTPVVFQDGFFVATGYDYYKALIKKRDKQEGERGGVKKTPTAPRDERENKQLEKVLEAPAAPPRPSSINPAAKPVSMCSKPRQLQIPPPPPEPEEEQEEIDIDSEDRRMLDDEREEDFNQW